MAFSSPLILLFLLPLLALLVWLCTGQLARRSVPFVVLWRSTSDIARPARALRYPPPWAVALLLAAMCMIVAAAEPYRSIEPADAVAPLTLDTFSIRNHQAMVRLRGGPRSTRGGVSLAAGDVSQHVDIDLPALETRDVFLDVPADAAAVAINIDAAGKPVLQATAARKHGQAVVAGGGGLPESVSRMIEVYGRHRPGDPAAGRVLVLAGGVQPIAGPAVFVDPPKQDAPSTGATEKPTENVDPAVSQIVADVDWLHVLAGVPLTASPPEEGWKSLVSIGGRAALAVRTLPSRQAWIGFDSPEFARSPAFVELWTNLLDWASGGAYLFELYTLSSAQSVAPPAAQQRSTAAVWLVLAGTFSVAAAWRSAAEARS